MYNKQEKREYYQKNKDKWRDYHKKNKDEINEKRRNVSQSRRDEINNLARLDRLKNPEKHKIRDKKNRDKRKANKEKHDKYLQYLKIYRQKNKLKRNQKEKERKLKDPAYKLACNARSKLLKIINRKQKSSSKIIGCNWDELKEHIEKQFRPGMSWLNHGSKGWHVDHIKQLCTAENLDELIALCHYSNLQPLWWYENLEKRFKKSA